MMVIEGHDMALGPILDFGLICVIDAAVSSKERGGLIAGKTPAPAYIPCKVGGGGEDCGGF